MDVNNGAEIAYTIRLKDGQIAEGKITIDRLLYAPDQATAQLDLEGLLQFVTNTFKTLQIRQSTS